MATELYITAEHYPPYSYKENGRPTGFLVELVHQIQEKIGEEKGEINFYPWARAYKQLQVGIADVLFPMGMTPERSAMFKFVGPVFWNDIYFYRLKGSSVVVESVEDARKVGKIAVTRDDLYHQTLRDMGFTNLDVSSSHKSDYLKLLKGRVDLLPMGERTLPHFLRAVPELGANDLERVGPAIFFTTTYIAFSLKTPDAVIKKWQEALDDLKKGGNWNNIMDKYFPSS
ncbi:substrate-binding periplasmic protein [Maridesulfovibrio hydrothermalis]|nr:transporter substrate-binding domain-containing protein [Maridesulfovibrio hydrothermalis]